MKKSNTILSQTLKSASTNSYGLRIKHLIKAAKLKFNCTWIGFGHLQAITSIGLRVLKQSMDAKLKETLST